jgi:hypothetical protein
MQVRAAPRSPWRISREGPDLMRSFLLHLWTLAMISGITFAIAGRWWGLPAAGAIYVVGEMLLPIRADESPPTNRTHS